MFKKALHGALDSLCNHISYLSSRFAVKYYEILSFRCKLAYTLSHAMHLKYLYRMQIRKFLQRIE